MGNCLVTKLKESINANLPILNSIRIVPKTAAVSNFKLSHLSSNGYTLTNVGGVFLDDNDQPLGTTITFQNPGRTHSVKMSAATNYVILPKENLVVLKELSNCDIPTINEIDYSELEEVQIALDCTTSDLSKLHLERLIGISLSSDQITGNISLLQSLLSGVTYCVLSSTYLDGDCNSWAVGRAQGTMTLAVPKSSNVKLTCNGVNLYNIGQTGRFTLTFDGQGNVTCAAL